MVKCANLPFFEIFSEYDDFSLENYFYYNGFKNFLNSLFCFILLFLLILIDILYFN